MTPALALKAAEGAALKPTANQLNYVIAVFPLG